MRRKEYSALGTVYLIVLYREGTRFVSFRFVREENGHQQLGQLLVSPQLGQLVRLVGLSQKDVLSFDRFGFGPFVVCLLCREANSSVQKTTTMCGERGDGEGEEAETEAESQRRISVAP